jgi:hypothetical protein
MKTFVCSVPKSGTYLLRQILEFAGLGKHHLHISLHGTYDYSKISREVADRNPASCRTMMSIAESVNRIPEGGFAVGHLPCTKSTRKDLAGVRVVFVSRRNLKDTVLSYMVHQHSTERCERSKANLVWSQVQDPQQRFIEYIKLRGHGIINAAKDILPWHDHAGLSLIYEDLISPSHRRSELGRIKEFLGSDTSVDDLELAFGMNTLTKSSDGNRDKYWSEAAHELLDGMLEE